ncbi:hypothetical protein HQ545_05645, partial [Candidatus Woesearchaeota archaeon]|nr:hypothetical protein [Candidatus Woesearchaeota archaeon]
KKVIAQQKVDKKPEEKKIVVEKTIPEAQENEAVETELEQALSEDKQ